MNTHTEPRPFYKPGVGRSGSLKPTLSTYARNFGSASGRAVFGMGANGLDFNKSSNSVGHAHSIHFVD